MLHRYCTKHGLYLATDKGCPKCKPPTSKRSKKYGGVKIHIPPNMKAR